MGVNPTRHVSVQYMGMNLITQQQSKQMPVQKRQCFNATRIAIEQRQHLGVVEGGGKLERSPLPSSATGKLETRVAAIFNF